MKHELRLHAAGGEVCAELRMTEHPAGIVVLAHGSGITRHDAPSRYVAASLVRAGFGAMLVDLLDEYEAHERHHALDVETQARRLVAVRDWLRAQSATRALGIGYFGSGVGAGVVLTAAAQAPEGVHAIVVRGGRPDTALIPLWRLDIPTLFIAPQDGADAGWIRAACQAVRAPKELVEIPRAGDAFGEHGANEAVAQHACRWFARQLAGAIEPRIQEFASCLKRHHPGSDCRVTVEDRVPRAYERRRYNVRFDVSFGGRSFVVNREHDDDPGEALRAAFAAANGQLDALQAARLAGG